jgi:SAM-dependent methyltransferase
MEQAFTKIYENNHWGQEHKNGPGSTFEATYIIRHTLAEIISKYKIKSIVDAGCGLYSWIDDLIKNDMEYIGLDIVKNQIDDNNRLPVGGKNLKFINCDVSTNYPLEANFKDLIFCKHLTQHLTETTTRKLLDNFRKSGCKYLLISNYDIDFNCESVEWSSKGCPRLDEGACRPQNLLMHPYNLSNVLESYPEYVLVKL